MAASVANSKVGTSSGGTSFALGWTPTVGNWLIVFLAQNATSIPTANAGWTLFKGFAEGGAHLGFGIYYRQVQLGDTGTIAPVTGSFSTPSPYTVWELAGLPNGLPTDIYDAYVRSNPPVPTFKTFTATNTGLLLAAQMERNVSAAITLSGLVYDHTDTTGNSGTGRDVTAGYKYLTAGTTYSPTISNTGGVTATCIIQIVDSTAVTPTAGAIIRRLASAFGNSAFDLQWTPIVGNYLLVVGVTANNTAAAAAAGWTRYDDLADAGGNMSSGVYYRQVQIGDTSTITPFALTGTLGAYSISEFSGLPNGLPTDFKSTYKNLGTSPSPGAYTTDTIIVVGLQRSATSDIVVGGGTYDAVNTTNHANNNRDVTASDKVLSGSFTPTVTFTGGSTAATWVIQVAAGNPTVQTAIGLGSMTVTGKTPTDIQAAAVGLGTIAFTGYAPGASLAQAIGAGSEAFSGFAPGFGMAQNVGAGAMTLTGFIPYVDTDFVSQVAALVLGEVYPDVMVSQEVALVVAEVLPEVRISQEAGLILGAVVPDVRVSQVAALILCEYEPCTTRRAQIWKITRRDGRVLGFTSHDEDIVVGGVTYKRCNSLNPSASENAANLGSVSNMELGGIISSDDITEADLYGGLYDDAYVEVWLYSWGDVSDVPKRLAAGWMGNISQGEQGFNSEVLGPGQRIGQQSLTDRITPGCRVDLGSPECGFDIEAAKITGSVLSTFRRDLISSDVADSSGGYQWTMGRIRFTSGANDGYEVEVRSVDFDTGEIELWIGTPFLASFGDTFDLLPGCDKAFGTCKDVYGRAIDQRGFPDIPGLDSIMDTPDAQY